VITPAADSQLRDEDLACLAGLKNLTNLQFVWPQRMAIGDQGLKHLAGLTNLQLLVVGSKVTDEGLGYMSNMKKLQNLTIYGDFTDQGLRQLAGLKALDFVRIRSDHPLSRDARNRLRQALPNCTFQEVQEPVKKKDRTRARQ